MKKLAPFAIRTLIVFAAFLWILSSVGEAATTQVDCSSASLQAAIEKAKPGDTLLVSGTCKENLVIHEEVARITLDGQGKATIEGRPDAGPTIRVRGRGITIKGFTITGGRNGLHVTGGGQATIDGNTIQGVRRGILVNWSSSASITNNTIQNNRSTGITLVDTSFAKIGNNTIKNNRSGITIAINSAAWVGVFRPRDRTASPNIIENNEGNGIVVTLVSSARIVGNTIRNNKRAGINVTRASSAYISSNTTDGNGGNGITVTRNAQVSLGRRRGTKIFRLPNNTTSNNSGVGIRCASGSSVEGRLGSLHGNKGAKDIDPSCVDLLKP